MNKIAVFTSGGDAPGMNACVRAVVRTALYMGKEVVGIKRGYEGMIDGDFVSLDKRSVSGIIQQGGTFLQSARSKRFMTKEGRSLAAKHLKAEGIDGIVAIGGDGTFTGANVFTSEHEFAFVGLPGTIDNDLVGTDFTIGYDTAVNTAMAAIDNIKDTANAHNRIFFIEVMGKDAGFIALRSAIATGAEAVLVPEHTTNLDELVDQLVTNRTAKKSANIVIVAEGDDAGGAFDVSKYVQEKIPEADIRVTVLGHIQRGGRPTCMERVRASQMGIEAVKSLINGDTGVMIGLINQCVVKTPFSQAIKHHQKIKPALLEMVQILG